MLTKIFTITIFLLLAFRSILLANYITQSRSGVAIESPLQGSGLQLESPLQGLGVGVGVGNADTVTIPGNLQSLVKPQVYDALLLTSVSSEALFKGDIDLVSYKPYKVTNNGTVPFVIKTQSKTIEIASNSTQDVMITDEMIDFLYGSDKREVKPLENKAPSITVQSLFNMDAGEVHLEKLQKVTSYRVTIIDDFSSQLELNVTGPVKYRIAKRTEEEIVIDITLDAYKTYSAFESFADRMNTDDYKTYFRIDVKDMYAPHHIYGQGYFRFTEW